MSRIVGIGRAQLLAGYALAGVDVLDAPDPAAVQRCWAGLDDSVGLVLLTEDARRALPDPLESPSVLWIALPG